MDSIEYINDLIEHNLYSFKSFSIGEQFGEDKFWAIVDGTPLRTIENKYKDKWIYLNSLTN